MKKTLIGFCCIFLLSEGFAAAAEQFPLRKEFPKVPTIELSELEAKYNSAVIVDVRSKFEFDVVHIDKAVLIPVSRMGFAEELLKVRSKDGTNPLVLYCNGIRCRKSYEGVEQAVALGFKNVFCFDEGIFPWVKKNPGKSFLMGKIPADPGKLIDEPQFKAKMVTMKEFKAAENDPAALFFDIRDPSQRKKVLDIKNLKVLPLDRILPMLRGGEVKNKKLYFMDEVGKQVEWLQYHLNDLGYMNYYFLKGGVEAN